MVKKFCKYVLVASLVLFFLYYVGIIPIEVFEGLGILGAVVVPVAMFFIVPISIGLLAGRKRMERKSSDINRDFQRKTNGINFKVDKIIGLGNSQAYFDLQNKQFYVAIKSGSSIKSKIYNLEELYKYTTGSDMLLNHQKYYIDLLINDVSCPRYRLWFGGNSTSVDDATAFIDLIWRNQQ